jgi:serine/threonine protein phosphatase PrpC
MLSSFAKTHIGQRQVNEDKYFIDEHVNLFIVADGVGGMDKGEVASNLACVEISNSISSGMTLKESVYSAHRQIIKQAKENAQLEGMATTIVAVLFDQNSYEIAWVGDSRAYIWDNGLKLLTRDDSYVELLLENGHISIDELETHPDRNVISQALGVQRKNITINYNSGTLENDQILLLCTDGLYSIANELCIINTIKKSKDIESITESLVNTAVENDGKDNITLLTIRNKDHFEGETTSIKPRVFREYDISTGKIVGLGLPDEEEAGQSSNSEKKPYVSDPELIDQTELTDLTKKDLDLLDSAAASHLLSQKEQGNDLFPVILITALVVIGLILYFVV